MAQAAALYWVGNEAAAIGVASNWTTVDPVACEPGGGQAPGPADEIIFDADCDTGATVTTDLAVAALVMRGGYGGTVRQWPATTVTVGHFQQDGGGYDTNGGLLIIGGAPVSFLPTAVPTPEPFLSQLPEPVLNGLEALPENALRVGLTALAMAAFLATLASMPGLWSSVMPDLLRGVLPLFGQLRRRRRPVGRVVNAADGMPITGAMVHIFDVTTSHLRETITTGADGSFGTILPPGTYLFSTRKAGYAPIFNGSGMLLFPGEQMATEKPLVVQEEGTVVPLVFFMQRMAPYARRERWRAQLVRGGRVAQIGLARISLPLLLAGAALNVAVLMRRPSPLLFGITMLYLLFLSLELFISRRFRRAFGKVLDAVAGKPVALAATRLFDPMTRRILQTRVTTAGGQYLMLAPRGNYQLQFAHPAYRPLEHRVAVRPALGSAVVFDAALTPRHAGGNPLY